MENRDYRNGEEVRHLTRALHEAKFDGWSKSGKMVGVHHNLAWPYGVAYTTTYFDPKNIERVKVDGE